MILKKTANKIKNKTKRIALFLDILSVLFEINLVILNIKPVLKSQNKPIRLNET